MDKNLSGMFPEYSLIDSGEGEKLEKFGSRLICRPSSLCIWKKREPSSHWKKSDAIYLPENGWIFSGAKFESWRVKISDFEITLRLQSNGQVGLFPEHLFSFPELERVIRKCLERQNSCRVLNLFAFTGSATVLAAKLGASVVHVDLSKKSLTWASENLALNNIQSDRIKLVPDDAIEFLKREERRNNKYDVIIVDPPSFSRISKTKSWKLEEILPSIIKSCSGLLPKESGAVFLSCHAPEIGACGIKNLLIDALDWCHPSIDALESAIPEKNSGRELPAGFICRATYGVFLEDT